MNTHYLKEKAVKGAGINVTVHIVIFAIQTAGVIFLARLLEPKDFGMVAMVTAFSQWFMNFGLNGFTEYIIQTPRIEKKTINAIFWIHVFLACVLALGFSLFGLVLVRFYSEPALTQVAAAMSTSIIFYALITSQMALLKRDMKFASIAIIDLAAVCLSVALAITAAIGGIGYWAVVTRQLTIPIVSMICVWIISPWRPGRPRYLSSALPGLKYAVQVYFNFSLGYVMRNIDKVLLGKFHGSELLGHYDRAYYLSSMPAVQLIVPIHSVALATLSRLRDDKERFLSYYIKAASTVSFLGSIAAALLTLTARDLIHLLLGPAWQEAGLVVMAFGPGIAALLLSGTIPWLHLALGTPNKWLRWNILAAVVTITAFVIAAPFGAVAMATAYSAVTYILVLPGLWYAGRPLQLRIQVMIHWIWPYFAAAICVSVCWLCLSAYWLPLNQFLVGISPLFRVILTSFIGLLLYLIAVVALQRSLRSLRGIHSLLTLMLTRKQLQNSNDDHKT